MNSSLENWIGRLQTDRMELCTTLSGIPEEQFTRPSQPGKWSIAEIVAHLITADRLSLEYMKKKSGAIETVGDAGWFEDFKMLAFTISQRIPIKYNAPKGVLQNTPRSIELSNLSNDWNAILQDYKIFLEGIPEQYTRRKIYKHPILGRIDARLCLQTLHEHYHHHLPQIKRLL